MALQAAAGEGRLTLEELTERLGRAYAARTSTDLAGLTEDLPVLSAPTDGAPRSPAQSVIAVMSGGDRTGRWHVPERLRAVAVMGGCKLDFRGAQITSQTVEVRAISIMGGIDIVVPEGVDVEVTGLAVMGGKSVRLADVQLQLGTPRLHVHVFCLMGGVSVRSKRAKRKQLSPPPAA